MSFNIQIHSDFYFSQQTALTDLSYLFNFNQFSLSNEPAKYKVYWSFKASPGASAIAYFPQLNINFSSQNESYIVADQNNNNNKSNCFGCIGYQRYSTGTSDYYYQTNASDNGPCYVTLNPNSSLINVRLTQPGTNTLIGNATGAYVLNLSFEKI
jgi:hypothetical protein